MKQFLTLVLLSYSLFAFSKGEPMKYGKIKEEEIQMTQCPIDSTAPAVVLCNYGYFDSNNFQFVHQIRIKILKEEGKDFANFFVPAAEKTNAKGQTMNMVDGKPVVTKLGKEGIFIEKITRDYYTARVAMPNVKVGSIIDVEFFYTGLPSYWKFQDLIPVMHSEISIESNMYLSFRKNYTGYIPLNTKDNNTWYTSNVPAFKSEAYMSSRNNYLAKFDIEVSSIHIAGSYYKELASSWDAVAKLLNEDDEFGYHYKHPGMHLFLSELKKEIAATNDSAFDKMKGAFEAMKSYKWNKRYALFPTDNSMDLNFKKKVGSVADINLTLLVLLRMLDIQAYPVILSTRDNGNLPLTATLNRFNYVVVNAYIGNKSYLLDATDENLPLGMLPERALNGRGMEIYDNDLYNWLDLNPTITNRKTKIYNLKISDSGNLNGSYIEINDGYFALDKRDKIKSFTNREDYLNKIESNTLFEVSDYQIESLDSLDKKLSEKYNFNSNSFVQKAGSQILIDLMRNDKLESNPFKMENRTYPVDFINSFEEKFLFTIDIPENVQLKQLPASTKISLFENAANLKIQSSASPNKIQILYTFTVTRPIFIASEYTGLKSFFDEMIRKHNEMLILEKI